MAIKVLGNVFTSGEKENKDGDSKELSRPLTEKELNFVLTKLREANYKGSEFEMFYTVFIKLNNLKTK